MPRAQTPWWTLKVCLKSYAEIPEGTILEDVVPDGVMRAMDILRTGGYIAPHTEGKTHLVLIPVENIACIELIEQEC